MAERAHPELAGFKNRFLGLLRSRYRNNLYRRYRFCNRHIRNRVVLDVPCGTGWGTSLLKGAKEVFGLDISEEAVAYGREHYAKIRFAVGDCAEIPFRAKMFDVIICLEGLEHFEPSKAVRFLDEAQRVSRFHGLLIITCPILDDEGKDTGNPYHLKEYDHQELVNMLNERFQIIHLERFRGPDGPEIKAVCRVTERAGA